MRANGGFYNFQYEILETNIPEDEGVYKERYYFDMYEPNLNNNVPGQTQDQSKLQYRTKNRLEIIEKVRNWQRENKERLNKYQREYKKIKKILLSHQLILMSLKQFIRKWMFKLYLWYLIFLKLLKKIYSILYTNVKI